MSNIQRYSPLNSSFLQKSWLLFLLVVASHSSHSQFSNNLTGSYIPLKWYPIVPYDKNEFSYVLIKGIYYQLSTDANDSSSVGAVDILVFNSKRKLVASNKAQPTDQPFRFTCKKNGIYYIICSYQKREPSLTLTLSFSLNPKKDWKRTNDLDKM